MTMTLLMVCWTLAALLMITDWCEGSIQCFCSTRECHDSHEITCNTDSLCYVQYTPPGPDIDPHAPKVVRGCIDGKTPLLCENQRPGVYSGSWPVLYCCTSDLCNKDAVPTLPPWATHLEDLQSRQRNDTDHEHTSRDQNLQQIIRRNPSNDHGDTYVQLPDNIISSSHVNPLYIGVPVAGACVLLAIIIFAIYILRRQHQMYEEHYQRTQQQIKRRPPSCQDGCRYITMPMPNGQYFARCQNGCLYSDCDRSSNGSESRLLAQV